ncbi:hypothetical protein SNEBB_006627 [Seison nebaliae]|nr:hypothetical protein SNEBB_006627 [Seison nebaliae]
MANIDRKPTIIATNVTAQHGQHTVIQQQQQQQQQEHHHQQRQQLPSHHIHSFNSTNQKNHEKKLFEQHRESEFDKNKFPKKTIDENQFVIQKSNDSGAQTTSNKLLTTSQLNRLDNLLENLLHEVDTVTESEEKVDGNLVKYVTTSIERKHPSETQIIEQNFHQSSPMHQQEHNHMRNEESFEKHLFDKNRCIDIDTPPQIEIKRTHQHQQPQYSATHNHQHHQQQQQQHQQQHQQQNENVEKKKYYSETFYRRYETDKTKPPVHHTSSTLINHIPKSRSSITEKHVYVNRPQSVRPIDYPIRTEEKKETIKDVRRLRASSYANDQQLEHFQPIYYPMTPCIYHPQPIHHQQQQQQQLFVPPQTNCCSYHCSSHCGGTSQRYRHHHHHHCCHQRKHSHSHRYHSNRDHRELQKPQENDISYSVSQMSQTNLPRHQSCDYRMNQLDIVDKSKYRRESNPYTSMMNHQNKDRYSYQQHAPITSSRRGTAPPSSRNIRLEAIPLNSPTIRQPISEGISPISQVSSLHRRMPSDFTVGNDTENAPLTVVSNFGDNLGESTHTIMNNVNGLHNRAYSLESSTFPQDRRPSETEKQLQENYISSTLRRQNRGQSLNRTLPMNVHTHDQSLPPNFNYNYEYREERERQQKYSNYDNQQKEQRRTSQISPISSNLSPFHQHQQQQQYYHHQQSDEHRQRYEYNQDHQQQQQQQQQQQRQRQQYGQNEQTLLKDENFEEKLKRTFEKDQLQNNNSSERMTLKHLPNGDVIVQGPCNDIILIKNGENNDSNTKCIMKTCQESLDEHSNYSQRQSELTGGNLHIQAFASTDGAQVTYNTEKDKKFKKRNLNDAYHVHRSVNQDEKASFDYSKNKQEIMEQYQEMMSHTSSSTSNAQTLQSNRPTGQVDSNRKRFLKETEKKLMEEERLSIVDKKSHERESTEYVKETVPNREDESDTLKSRKMKETTATTNGTIITNEHAKNLNGHELMEKEDNIIKTRQSKIHRIAQDQQKEHMKTKEQCETHQLINNCHIEDKNDKFQQQNEIITNGPTNVQKTLLSESVGVASTVSSRKTRIDDLSIEARIENTQHIWYRPKISRDNAINQLLHKAAGNFIIRDSNSFPGAFGLAMKVNQLPPGIKMRQGVDPAIEFVRHFLIESKNGGVRLKGCPSEPIFENLSCLVLKHIETPLALPCQLVIPDLTDTSGSEIGINKKAEMKSSTISYNLLHQGAACHVVYLGSFGVGNLNGFNAIGRAISQKIIEVLRLHNSLINKELTGDALLAKSSVVHFKAALNGITLTDENKRMLTKTHWNLNEVIFNNLCMKTEDLFNNLTIGNTAKTLSTDKNVITWNELIDVTMSSMAPSSSSSVISEEIGDNYTKSTFNQLSKDAKLFSLIVQTEKQNECLLFVEYEEQQPATAIISFINKLYTYQKLQLEC